MKKVFLTLATILTVFLSSCNKNNQYTVLIVDYLLAGNQVVLDEEGYMSDSTPVIFINDKEKFKLPAGNFATDIAGNLEINFVCGFHINEDESHSPRLWKDGVEVSSELNTLEGQFNQVLHVNTDAVTIGEVDNKGVLAVNGKKVYEYGVEGKHVEFDTFNIDPVGRFVIAGSIDGKVCIWKVNAVGGNYTLDGSVFSPDELQMSYEKYSYNIADLTMSYNYAYNQTFVALTRTENATGKTEACFCTENKLFTLDGKASKGGCISFYRNSILVGGCAANKDGMMVAAVWDDTYKQWNDFSEGLDKTNQSRVVRMYNDGLGITHVCMQGSGKIQYQMLGTYNNPVEFKVSDNYMAMGMCYTMRQEVITE